MTILGLDPGLERVGYGLVRREGSRLVAVDHGLLQTPRIELPDRLQMLFEGLSELIARHRPEAAALEKLLFAVNKTNAMDVARASGVLLLACRQADVPVSEITPPEVKLAVVGNGAAEKRQVQFMVAKLLGLRETPKPDDVADALAVAIAHAMRSRTPLPMP
jgi:crossover junction endodeoxyribonuclease RuvC